jgi:hypothetical protein
MDSELKPSRNDDTKSVSSLRHRAKVKTKLAFDFEIARIFWVPCHENKLANGVSAMGCSPQDIQIRQRNWWGATIVFRRNSNRSRIFGLPSPQALVFTYLVEENCIKFGALAVLKKTT